MQLLQFLASKLCRAAAGMTHYEDNHTLQNNDLEGVISSWVESSMAGGVISSFG